MGEIKIDSEEAFGGLGGSRHIKRSPTQTSRKIDSLALIRYLHLDELSKSPRDHLTSSRRYHQKQWLIRDCRNTQKAEDIGDNHNIYRASGNTDQRNSFAIEILNKSDGQPIHSWTVFQTIGQSTLRGNLVSLLSQGTLHLRLKVQQSMQMSVL